MFYARTIYKIYAKIAACSGDPLLKTRATFIATGFHQLCSDNTWDVIEEADLAGLGDHFLRDHFSLHLLDELHETNDELADLLHLACY